MKKEDVLNRIDELIEIDKEEFEDFQSRLKFQKELETFRTEISKVKIIALDIHSQVKERLDDLSRISIASGISKITLVFSHLGTAMKTNRNFHANIVISEFLKSKTGNIAASTLKDMLKELVSVLVEEPELVQVSNYEKLFRKKLTAEGWEIGKEYEAKDKTLTEDFFEGKLSDVYRNVFKEYIKFKSGFMYPYAMVVNSAKDIRTVVDSASSEIDVFLEKDRYQNEALKPVISYKMLNVFQKIDWLRRKVEVIMENIDNNSCETGDSEISTVFATMELHDVRVIFGHLLPILK